MIDYTLAALQWYYDILNDALFRYGIPVHDDRVVVIRAIRARRREEKRG